MKENKRRMKGMRLAAMTLAAKVTVTLLLAVMTAATAGAQTIVQVIVNEVAMKYNDDGELSSYVDATCGSATASPTSGPAGTNVMLNASPGTGYIFYKWESDLGEISKPNDAKTTLIIAGEEPHNVTAYFIKGNHKVSAKASQEYMGTVLLSKNGAQWSSMVVSNAGDKIYFKYSAAIGYMLDGSMPNITMASNGESVTPTYPGGGRDPYFIMPDDDVTVTVGFKQDPNGVSLDAKLEVTTTKWEKINNGGYGSNGSGGGRASASYSTNGSGGGTASASSSLNVTLEAVPLGAEVTLTATPDYSLGWQFMRWDVYPSDTYIADRFSATTTMRMPPNSVTVDAVFWKNDVLMLGEGEGFNNDMALGFSGKDVHFVRKFSGGVASTVCLPFSLTPEESLGQFYGFSGVSRATSPWEVTMTQRTVLEAGKPYLFAPAANGDIDFSGKLTEGTSALAGSTSAADATTGGTWTFRGTYETIEWKTDPQTIYGYSSGQAYGDSRDDRAAGEFIRVRTGGIRPFRAYLEYTASTGARGVTRGDDGDALPETMTVRLIGLDGQTTGIGTLSTRTGEISFDGWYTLDGHRLSSQPTQKGIYIHNGRKEAIR